MAEKSPLTKLKKGNLSEIFSKKPSRQNITEQGYGTVGISEKGETVFVL
ncbi:MAG: hypothetical protein KAI16_03355 [Candidatus Pacebacteria bacterium]|nr:hypothetical protein [Candidatus Paceibacterota bacterium]